MPWGSTANLRPALGRSHIVMTKVRIGPTADVDAFPLCMKRWVASTTNPRRVKEYTIPSVFNMAVASAVAEGVARTAHQTGVAGWCRRREVAPVW